MNPPPGDFSPLCHHALMDLWELADLCTPWCVHVVATLRVADHIAAGKENIEEIAAAAGADRDAPPSGAPPSGE